MNESNHNQENLEQKLLDKYQNHIASSISNYMIEKNHNLTSASESLNYARSTLGDWKSKRAIAGWDAYFELMLNLKGTSSESKATELQTLNENLTGFLSDSIKTYRTKKRISSNDLAKESGFSKSSINSWANKRIMPKPKEFFKLISTIFKDEEPYLILRPIMNLDYLKQKDYDSILANIKLSTQTQSTIDISEESQNKAEDMRQRILELGELVNYFKKGDVKDREYLRTTCETELQRFGLTLSEARQILRKESNYQDWLKMNE